MKKKQPKRQLHSTIRGFEMAFPIMARPTVDKDLLFDHIAGMGAKVSPIFLTDIFWEVWHCAAEYGVDPLGAVAQSAKETDWGNFTGVITAEWRNTAGIKTRAIIQRQYQSISGGDLPFAHQIFPSWHSGAMAQVSHLRSYCHSPINDAVNMDPRAALISQIGEPCVYWRDLNGKWAGPDYGSEIEGMMNDLIGTSL